MSWTVTRLVNYFTEGIGDSVFWKTTCILKMTTNIGWASGERCLLVAKGFLGLS